MNRGDAHFLVLFIVNVFQPVTKSDLFKEFTRTAASPGGGLDVLASESLKELIRRGLVVETSGTLSCTILGNERTAKLGLRKARDKNRLFFLKSALRRDYN
jgi:hypothetical protein